jgi:ABC-type branched-subunit amino acid transport system substrate-binding protein
MLSLTRSPCRHRRTAGSAAALAAVCAVALSACASSGSSGSSGTSAGTDPSAYRLMVFGEFSVGPGAQLPTAYSEIATGAEAAAAVINKAGGVNGHKVDITVCDTKGSPNGATSCAYQAVQDKVVAVVGSLDLTGSYMSVLQQAGIPAIGPYAIAQTLVNTYSYPLYGGSATNLAGSVSTLAKQGVKSISIVANQSAGLAALAPLLKPVQQHYPGLTISLDPIASTTVDLAPVVAQANRSDGIVLATNNAATAVEFLKTEQESGVKKPIAASTTQVDQQLLAQAGSLLQQLNVRVVGAWLPSTDTQNAAVAAFDRAMSAQDPSAAKDDFSMDSYASVELFSKVAGGLSEVTSATVRSALASVTASAPVNLGLVAPLQFATPSADASNLPRLFNPDVVIESVQDSKLVPANGKFVNAYSQQQA